MTDRAGQTSGGKTAQELAARARPLMANGNFAEALGLFDELVQQYPKIRNFNYLRGVCLAKLGRFREAHEALLQEIREFGLSTEVNVLLVFLLGDPNRGFPARELMRRQELHVFSQNGEDGILLYLFSLLGTTHRTFVEFGVGNGMECNTANLAFNWGWQGLLLEGSEKDVLQARKNYAGRPVAIAHAFITAESINDQIRANGVSGPIDLLSIDIDGNDWWVWKAITVVEPRVVVVEYNASFGPERSITVPYAPDFSRLNFPPEKQAYHGASLAAFEKLGAEKGYILAGCDSNGCNAFFVRSDVAARKISRQTSAQAYYPQVFRSETLSTEQQFALVKDLPFVSV